MTVCGKSNETTKMSSSNGNLNSVNRPSFMITDILSKSAAAAGKEMSAPSTEYLQHLQRFSAMNGNRFGFGMPLPGNLDVSQQKNNNFCESDDESDDVDGQSSDDGSNSKYFHLFFIQFVCADCFFPCELWIIIIRESIWVLGPSGDL